VYSLNNTKLEAGRQFMNEKREYLKDKFNGLVTNNK
jgi:hypothetical protein